MNKQRRNRIYEIHMKLTDLLEDLMSITDEEDETIENLPDLQDAIETLDDVCSLLWTIFEEVRS